MIPHDGLYPIKEMDNGRYAEQNKWRNVTSYFSIGVPSNDFLSLSVPGVRSLITRRGKRTSLKPKEKSNRIWLHIPGAGIVTLKNG